MIINHNTRVLSPLSPGLPLVEVAAHQPAPLKQGRHIKRDLVLKILKKHKVLLSGQMLGSCFISWHDVRADAPEDRCL